MDEIGAAAGYTSSSKSMPYIYGETDLYLDSTNTSTSSSPMDSPVGSSCNSLS